jgi:uncharacterized Rmd1/YagE family protein
MRARTGGLVYTPLSCREQVVGCQTGQRSFFDFGGGSNGASATISRALDISTQSKQHAMQQMGLWGPGSAGGGTRPSARIGEPLRRTPKRLPPRYRKREPDLRDKLLPVSAIHIAQTIDLFPIMSTVFARNTVKKQMFGKNSVVVQMAPLTDLDPPRYVAVFRFGSVVGLNISPRELILLVDEIRSHAREPVLQGYERKEYFGVMVDSSDLYADIDSEDVNVVTGDYCIVSELNMTGFAVISSIMAQTVALDTYNDTVDNLLANFTSVNSAVTKTGQLTSTDKNFLFKTIAQNNSIFIDMISKIRIKERSETAWNLASTYQKIHYGMKEEFEIDDRFDHIEFKLNLIQQNAKFFLEVLQHQKSSNLEWVIVILITLECGLMCVEMSGMGEAFFAALGLL